MLFWKNYYYLILVLQGICIFHCLRKGNQKWIWVIVFLPVVGCAVYFFSEILTGNNVRNVSNGLGTVINPGGSVRKLEAQLKFADTHQNKVALADAYLAHGDIQKAISLYEESRTGVFVNNDYVLMRLIVAYAKIKKYEAILPLAEKLKHAPQFQRSKAHIEYAKALFFTGHTEAAEKEFAGMKGKFAHYEPRYYYGLFLSETGRPDKAVVLFNEMMNEQKHLGSRERREARPWIEKARQELKKMETVA